MYKILLIFMMCCVFLSCKMVASGTSDIVKEDNGRYFYAWTSTVNEWRPVLCMGICNRKPTSMEEALTSVCNKDVKYLMISLKSEELNKQYIVDSDTDIGFLYNLAEESNDAVEVCLSDSRILNKHLQDNAYLSDSYYSPRVYSKPSPSNLTMSQQEFNEYNDQNQIQELTTVRSITNSDLNDGMEKAPYGDDTEYIIVVKPTKVGLSYAQAKAYCKEPDEQTKKYVKDWSKVGLGGDKIDQYYLAIWSSDPKNNPKVSDDNKDVYTVCVTDKDNLQDVYIYKIEISW